MTMHSFKEPGDWQPHPESGGTARYAGPYMAILMQTVEHWVWLVREIDGPRIDNGEAHLEDEARAAADSVLLAMYRLWLHRR